jgi:hypothetical protein
MNLVLSEYNQLLSRHNKAVEFLESNAMDKEKDKWMPEFIKIVKQCNKAIAEIQKVRPVRDKEILNGFCESN